MHADRCDDCSTCDGGSSRWEPCRDCMPDEYLTHEQEAAYGLGVKAVTNGAAAEIIEGRDIRDPIDLHMLWGVGAAIGGFTPGGWDSDRLIEVAPPDSGIFSGQAVSGWVSADGQAHIPIEPPMDERAAAAMLLGECSTPGEVVHLFSGWWVLAWDGEA